MCYVKMLSVILYSSPTQFIPGQHLRVFEKFSYDAYGQNVRVLASGKDGSETFFVDRLLLYREVKYHGLRRNSIARHVFCTIHHWGLCC